MDPVPPEPSDADLWNRSTGGDATAFGALFVRHHTAVYRSCLIATGSVHVAEDLVSMTFLETWRRRRSVTVDESILPWLFAVSRNLTRNYRRSSGRYARLLATLPRTAEAGGDEDARIQRVDDARRLRRVERILRTLSSEDRDVIRVCALAGLSHAEAAEVLGIPIGTVKSRLARARERLRRAEAFDMPAPVMPGEPLGGTR